MGYGPPEGHPALREAIATYLKEKRGVDCDARQIVIVNGSQQALDLVARVLIDPGDRVAIEEPCYPGLRNVLTGVGAQILPMSVDGQGLAVEDLQRTRGRMRLICVTPSHQYPTGAVMSLNRRLALLAFARRKDAIILEDDYDSEFRYGTRLERALQGLDQNDLVIYVGTFSKVLFPALRIGYLVLPRKLVTNFSVAKSITDRYTAPFFQMILAEFITAGHFERHLGRVRREVSERREALIAELTVQFGDRIQVFGQNAGVHLLVEFLRLSREEFGARVARAAELGVAVYPANSCYSLVTRTPGLVMGYASMSVSQIREGTRLLSRAFKHGFA